MLKGYPAGLDAGPRNECWFDAEPAQPCGDGAGAGFWGKFATSSRHPNKYNTKNGGGVNDSFQALK